MVSRLRLDYFEFYPCLSFPDLDTDGLPDYFEFYIFTVAYYYDRDGDGNNDFSFQDFDGDNNGVEGTYINML